MTAAEVLALARTLGVMIRPNGADLDIVADDKPDPVLLDAVAGCKGEILARFRTERGRINHWIAKQIIAWPPTSCLNCRKPIVPGQPWVAVSSGEVTARFHKPCHAEWLAKQEVLARQAMGLDP
jgi:hypothetical protein